ncbi:MAG: hypothetical protein FJ224_09350, partial [Lentisphaerae bacterium]|nr:hypothetical protein [Lentisphaerota bacterium]
MSQRRRIILLASLSAVLGVEPARCVEHQSIALIEPYNELVRMVYARCEAAGVDWGQYANITLKDPTGKDPYNRVVKQSDLNNIRCRVVLLLKDCYTSPPEDGDHTSPDIAVAFPPGYPALMDGLGNKCGLFTKVPARHCSGGQGVYSNDFIDVPVLPVHLKELHSVMTRMRYARRIGSWRSEGEPNTRGGQFGGNQTSWQDAVNLAESIYAAAPWPTDGSPYARATAWNSTYLYRAGLFRRCARYRLDGLPKAWSRSITFYSYAIPPADGDWSANGDADLEQNRWTAWHTAPPSTNATVVSDALGSIEARPDWCDQPADESTARGYEVINAVALLHYESLPVGILNIPEDLDEYDCGGPGNACGTCDPGVKVHWNGAYPVVELPAGSSDGRQTAGASLGTYHAEWFIEGVPRQTYGPDTKVIAHLFNDAEGWEYVTILRPTGAEVSFAMKGAAPGMPVEPYHNRGYRLVEAGGMGVESESTGFSTQNTGWVLRLNGHSGASVGYDLLGQLSEMRVTAAGSDITTAAAPDDWLGVTTTRDPKSRRPIYTWSPSLVAGYTGGKDGLVNRVDYWSPDITPVGHVELGWTNGMRVYRERTPEGAVKRETYIRTSPQRTEVWRGKMESNGFSGTREMRFTCYDPVLDKIT